MKQAVTRAAMLREGHHISTWTKSNIPGWGILSTAARQARQVMCKLLCRISKQNVRTLFVLMEASECISVVHREG